MVQWVWCSGCGREAVWWAVGVTGWRKLLRLETNWARGNYVASEVSISTHCSLQHTTTPHPLHHTHYTTPTPCPLTASAYCVGAAARRPHWRHLVRQPLPTPQLTVHSLGVVLLCVLECLLRAQKTARSESGVIRRRCSPSAALSSQCCNHLLYCIRCCEAIRALSSACTQAVAH